jgi:hypothetical protein
VKNGSRFSRIPACFRPAARRLPTSAGISFLRKSFLDFLSPSWLIPWN